MSQPFSLSLPHGLRQWLERRRALRQLAREGWQEPLPHFLKVAILVAEARAFRAEVFVETGTFLGDTTAALASEVRAIHTLEVEPSLRARAVKRFRNAPHVNVVLGDSGTALPGILAGLAPGDRVMFWLDGHYSGGFTGRGERDCPVVEELHAIAASGLRAVHILIDDLRVFGTNPEYPSQQALKALAAELFPDAIQRVANDIFVVSRTS
jgi:hypothetical protein